MTGGVCTTSSPPNVFIIGPLYLSNLTNTTLGSAGGHCFTNKMSFTTPIEPLTNPAAVHKLTVSMIRQPFAINSCGSSPFATSELARLASLPVCYAFILAIGWLSFLSISMLILFTSSHFDCMNTASLKLSSSLLFTFSSNRLANRLGCRRIRVISGVYP